MPSFQEPRVPHQRRTVATRQFIVPHLSFTGLVSTGHVYLDSCSTETWTQLNDFLLGTCSIQQKTDIVQNFKGDR